MIKYQYGPHRLDPVSVLYNGIYTGALEFIHQRWGYYPKGSCKCDKPFYNQRDLQAYLVKLLKGEKK